MIIKMDGTPYLAAVVCSGTYGAPGAWTLHLVTEDGEDMSEALMKWDPSPLPIPLLSRLDALALMGFAVVTGGVDAWKWNERADGDGSYFVGMTPVRPLRDDERAVTAAPALERFHV
ncbi:hypothetical protein [Streptomyces sp. NPDC000878]